MMSDRQSSCEERIDDRLSYRLEMLLPELDTVEQCEEVISYFGIGWEQPASDEYDDDDELLEMFQETINEELHDRISESVLSIDKTTKYRVCLSWGGPADYFDFVYSDGELIEVWYIFQDWYDGARRKVDDSIGDMLADLFCVGQDFE